MHTRLTRSAVRFVFVFALAFASSVNADPITINFLPTDGVGDYGSDNIPKDAARPGERDCPGGWLATTNYAQVAPPWRSPAPRVELGLISR